MSKEELKKYYQDTMYGRWRSAETVTYEHLDDECVKIFVEKEGKSVSFTVKMYLPEKEACEQFAGNNPFIISMHPIAPTELALASGYAVIVLDTYQIASDDNKHNGCFYELYPYGNRPAEQTGVLMAWAWGAAKVIDAVEGGLGNREVGETEELLQNASAKHPILVTGVSRWGKATAVCGAFDERVTMTVPVCSGAGGLALYGFLSEGKTYNLESVGGPAAYTYGQNEPLSCLQSEAEQGWFNDKFLEYQSAEDIPLDQHMLPVLAADEKRFYFIVAAYMGEDWVNAPSMWECYKKADGIYSQMGLREHLVVHFHKEGHAVIEEDMKLLISYFNKMCYGLGEEPDWELLKNTAFAGQE